jgi:hypothetical protein
MRDLICIFWTTNCRDGRASCEVSNSSDTEEIPRILGNTAFTRDCYFYLYATVLINFKFFLYNFNIHFSIIFQATFVYSEWSVHFGFPHKNCVHISVLAINCVL